MPLMLKHFLTLLLCLSFQTLAAAETDSLKLWGASVSVLPSSVVATDEFVKKWLKTHTSMAIDVGLLRQAPLSADDEFASDYGFPRFELHLKYIYNKVRLHRDADPAWGQLQPVDYDSKLGNVLSLYATFERPFYRHKRWQMSYAFSTGAAYAFSPYHTERNIDNELVGTHFNIYFGAGVHVAYRLQRNWALQAGLEFFHYSNGAVSRPNKGANHVGPSLSLLYTPFAEATWQHYARASKPFQKQFYLEPEVSVAFKTLNEDWQLTQFDTPPTDPNYRRKHFHLYTSYNASFSMMYRYARRWSSGLALDVNRGNYARHVEQLDTEAGYELKHSPWSVGISARHHVFYSQLSLRMALGAYLYRHMGHNAKEVEKPYYETIGLHYTFRRFGNLTIGADVKAHLTKADYLQLALSVPIQLGKKQ